METELVSFEMSPAQYEHISDLIYKLCGINLHIGKEVLVKARLTKRLRALNLCGFDDYIDFLENEDSGTELSEMVDALTTNKTSFFRESQHFDYLRTSILPELSERGNKVRIWSAGCSSGEEPFTLAVVLREALPKIDDMDVRILATDISTKVLSKAREAVYSADILRDLPVGVVQRHFTCIKSKPCSSYKAKDSLKSLIQWARLNLMESWPMKGPFDAIFCRNVMIYFDKPTQQRLVNRFAELLAPGGHLFVGHSESLTGTNHGLRYVQPAIYKK